VPPAREPVDWEVAARVARTVGGTGPPTTPAIRNAFRDDAREFGALADALVRDFTGLEPDEPLPQPTVLDRAGWVRANIEGFRHLIKPFSEKLASPVAALGIGRRITSAALGAQLGILLGYLSQKVLGQYDLVLGAESAGKVYFVGPNIVEVERRWELEPRDFRLWIALHEVTHRTQFTAVPWLRDRVHGMMERSLASMELDAEKVRGIVKRGRELLLGGPEAWKRATIMDLLLPPDQRSLIDDMQALMTVVEGHGTFVMNRIGRERIPTFERMNEMVHTRRGSARGPERTFQRVIGMDMKYEQYALGERFMEAVAERAGVRAVNKVWERPENVPTPDDLRDPDAWMRRVGT
jgi:coenzyme F420 biosynthesis associated uncharacterized protein